MHLDLPMLSGFELMMVMLFALGIIVGLVLGIASLFTRPVKGAAAPNPPGSPVYDPTKPIDSGAWTGHLDDEELVELERKITTIL